MSSTRLQQFLKTLGPGIMFAGTCIGGSHLIQSTKAGAFYGFGLLLVVVLANFFKYPFFEFASRYTNATGDSVLEGYFRLGKWALWIYAIVTVSSMFFITAAIVSFTAGLANNFAQDFFGLAVDRLWWAAFVLSVVFGLLSYGKFAVLDKVLKLIGLILLGTVSTAFLMLLGRPSTIDSPTVLEVLMDSKGFLFAVFLMGWMPMGVDMSAWHSLWTQERIRQTGYHPTLRETLLDFNIGYGITVVLAFFFLAIGAKTLYGTVSFDVLKAQSSLGYAHTLVDTFSKVIGGWSTLVISIAAFSTMFGTSITLADGYCRSVNRSFYLLNMSALSSKGHLTDNNRSYLVILLLLFIGSFIVIWLLCDQLSSIMAIATGTSFLIAPIVGYFNYRIVFNEEVKKEFRPSRWLRYLAVVGLIFLTVFSLVYIFKICF